MDEIELCVYFCCKWGLEAYHDPEFGIPVEWDIPLVQGYPHEFLAIKAPPQRLTFWTIDNPSITRRLESFKPHVVKIFGYAHRTMWRVRAWTARNRVPLLLYSDSNVKAENPLAKEMIKRIIVRFFYRRVDGALYVGDNNLAFHKLYGLTEDRLFPGVLPIDRDLLLSSVPNADEARHEIRKSLGIPPDGIVALFCGKFIARKRPMDILMATSQLRDEQIAIWPIFVGEGCMRNEMERYCVERKLRTVALTGFVNQSKIAKYFAASDFLVITSDYDPHPLVVTEAGTFGLPVIVSDKVGCVGAHDTARPNGNAIVFRCGDVEDLARAIRDMRVSTTRASMGEEALRMSRTQDVKVAAAQLNTAVKRLAALGPRR